MNAAAGADPRTGATGAASSVPTATVSLSNGGRMPLLGFGTWQLTGQQAAEAVATALEVGYRHVDTATMYGNEAEVGAAVAAGGIAGEQVFLTSKLPPDRAGDARRTLEDTLSRLGVDSLDLWLVHWPPEDGVGVSTWREFIRAHEEGLVTDIGVSNYSLESIDRLTAATDVTPAVNQVPWSPKRYDARVAEGHAERQVVLEGYSGLKGGVLSDPTVTDIAARVGRSPAQVVIRWHLQHGVVVIPKSAHPGRIRENADVGAFALAEEDMRALDRLGGGG